MSSPKDHARRFADQHASPSTQLLTPITPLQLDAEERCEYLRRLFQMDIRLATFVSIARSLGFGVSCEWDCAAHMPRLVWLH
jgi:hypothetical protein